MEETYTVNKAELEYIPLNDIQTEKVRLGEIAFESQDLSVIEVNEEGIVMPKALRNNKSKNNR